MYRAGPGTDLRSHAFATPGLERQRRTRAHFDGVVVLPRRCSAPSNSRAERPVDRSELAALVHHCRGQRPPAGHRRLHRRRVLARLTAALATAVWDTRPVDKMDLRQVRLLAIHLWEPPWPVRGIAGRVQPLLAWRLARYVGWRA